MNDMILRGLRALDSVKHCQEVMTDKMQENDTTMRDTPPIEWTEEQVLNAEATARYVNEL